MKLGKPSTKLLFSHRTGHVCQYCDIDTHKAPDTQVYGGKGWGGFVRLCPECNAYVSCHAATGAAMGSVALAPLRAIRRQAHAAVDALWKQAPKGSGMRSKVYYAMARYMGTPDGVCHIAMFNESQCRIAIGFAAQAGVPKNNGTLPLKTVKPLRSS